MNEQVRLWKPPFPISGHLWCFGRIGSGKTVKLLTLAQAYHSLGYKIWDIFGGKRNEGPFWSLKNDDDKLWETFEQETYEFSEPGPKEYQVNLLYPMFTSLLPKNLPTTLPNSPRIKSKVFTIPIKDIDINDVKNVLGEVGGNTIYAWETLQEELTNNNTGEYVKYLFDTKLSSSKNLAVYKLFLKTLIDNHTLSPKNFDLNFNFIDEAKDKKTISVLCLDYVPERFHLFIMGYFQRKIRNYLEKDKIHKKNIALYREASLFMKTVDSSGSAGDATQVFRNQFSNLARYGRDGFYIFADTQSPKEVGNMLDGQEDLLCICEMPSIGDRDALCEPIKKDGRISKMMISHIAVLPIYQMVVVPRREHAKLIKRITPSRTRYWKEGKGNFYTIWKKEIDTWKNIINDKEMIIKLYKDEFNKIQIKKLEKEVNEEEIKEDVINVKKEPIVKIAKKGRPIKTEEEKKLELEAIDEELEKWKESELNIDGLSIPEQENISENLDEDVDIAKNIGNNTNE